MLRRSIVLLAAILGVGLAQWTPRGGGDHGGTDWTPAAGDSISGYHYNVGTFTIPGGQTNVIYQWNGNDSTGRLQIRANNIIMSGILTGAGRGYGGGGGGDNSDVVPPVGAGGYGGRNGNGGNGQHAYWSWYGWPSTAYFGGGGGGSPNGTGGQGQANGSVGTLNGGGNGGSPTNGGGPGGTGGIGYGAGGGGGGGFSAGGGGGGGGGTGGDSAYWYNGGKGAGTYGGNGGTHGEPPSQAGNGGYLASNGNGDTSTDSTVYRGGGGGGGGSSSNGGYGGGGGGGGAGGSYVRLEAQNTLTLAGRIFAQGAAGGQSAGPNFTSYYGGGGAGGGILLVAPFVTLRSSCTLDVRGRQYQTLSTQNGGTIKVFYGNLNDTAAKYYGRLFTRQMSIHDVGATHIPIPAGILDSGLVVTPACSVRNFGMYSESYTVRMKVGSLYNATVGIASHSAGTALYVTFPAWTALERGGLVTSCSTELAGDMNAPNNKTAGTVLVRVFDAGATAIVDPSGGTDSGVATTPRASIRNFGNVAATMDIRLTADDGYTSTINRTVAGGAESTFAFAAWTPSVRGSRTLKCSTLLANDVQRSNDAITGSVMVNVHDPGLAEIVNPTPVVPPGPMTPQVKAHNYGTVRDPCDVTFRINGLTPYIQTINLPGGLPAGALLAPGRCG